MNTITTVNANREAVRIELVRQDKPGHSTVLAFFSFNRLSADLQLTWCTDSKALSVLDKIGFAINCLRLTSRIVK